MNTIQINEILEKDSISKKTFIGVFSRDKIPKISNKNYPCSYVVNTDNSKQPGEHWLAVYYDENGDCDFFDSLAFNPKFYGITKQLTKSANTLTFLTYPIQSIFSQYCGFYCVLFILFRSRNYSLESFLKLFDKDTLKNDKLILNLISKF